MVEFTAKLHKNKNNGQITLSIPKRKFRFKKIPKYIEIKKFRFIE